MHHRQRGDHRAMAKPMVAAYIATKFFDGEAVLMADCTDLQHHLQPHGIEYRHPYDVLSNLKYSGCSARS